ncbi:hypothetical protein BGX28_002137, partial [Mortierella sp. GBA30]
MSSLPPFSDPSRDHNAGEGSSSSAPVPTPDPAPTSAFSTPSTTTVVMPSNFRMRPPTPYEGARDGFLCEAWLSSLRRFLVAANIPVEQRTLHAVMYLSGNAALWWEGMRLPDWTPIDEFVALFRAAFCPRNFLESVRSELLRITMTSSLSEYITRFRRYMAVLTPEMHEIND